MYDLLRVTLVKRLESLPSRRGSILIDVGPQKPTPRALTAGHSRLRGDLVDQASIAQSAQDSRIVSPSFSAFRRRRGRLARASRITLGSRRRSRRRRRRRCRLAILPIDAPVGRRSGGIGGRRQIIKGKSFGSHTAGRKGRGKRRCRRRRRRCAFGRLKHLDGRHLPSGADARRSFLN